MSSLDDLDILNLHPDIIRIVIQVGQEDIDSMRLISPRWNNLSIEHLHTRKKLPVIKNFRWNTNLIGFSKLVLCMPYRFRKYFGVESWEYRSSANGESIFELYPTENEMNTVCRNLRRSIDRCSRIAQLDLPIALDHIRLLKNVLNGTIVDQLSYSENNYLGDATPIFEITDACKVTRLIQKVTYFDSDSRVLLKYYSNCLYRVAVELVSHNHNDHFEMPHARQMLSVPKRVMDNLMSIVRVRRSPEPEPEPEPDIVDETRDKWINFTAFLNKTGEVTANFHEETDLNGRVKFSVVMRLKEAS